MIFVAIILTPVEHTLYIFISIYCSYCNGIVLYQRIAIYFYIVVEINLDIWHAGSPQVKYNTLIQTLKGRLF